MTTHREPGGPQDAELDLTNVFIAELAEIERAWGDDSEAVNRATDKINDLLWRHTSDGQPPLISTRAVQWYKVPRDEFDKGYYYLDAEVEDEPLHMDGKGPWVAGEAVRVEAREIPDRPGIGWYDSSAADHRNLSPMVLGLVVSNMAVRDGQYPGEIDTDRVAFVPLRFMTSPTLQVASIEVAD